MLPGVILPSDGLSGLGRFEKGTLCCVCLKGNRLVRGRYRSQSCSTQTASLGQINLDQLKSNNTTDNTIEEIETLYLFEV